MSPISVSERLGPSDQPLAGVRIAELSSRPSGAYCGRLLSLLGATVLRVALPVGADCPPDLQDDFEASLNDGKQEIPLAEAAELVAAFGSIDLAIVDSRYDDALDGQVVELTRQVIAELAERCPIVDIAGHRPASGADRFPVTALTESALAAMSWSLGHPGLPPLPLPNDLAEFLAGTEAAGAASLALAVAEAAPELVQVWDIAATDVIASYVGEISANFIPYERPWRRDGPRAAMSGGSYPGAMFACSDGHISIMCRTPREWLALLRAMGDPAWSAPDHMRDPRVIARFHADEVDVYVNAWTASHTRDEMFALGKEFGFPIAPVLTVSESIELEHFADRDFLTKADGLVRAGAPFKFAAVEGRPTRSSTWPAAKLALTAPLAGLKVLDLSWVWSGPMVTAALGDLGAEILKIEHRGRADPARLRGRAIRNGQPVDGPELEVTPYFNQMNHGKRSIALDISSDAGRDLILDLAAECDVVVENMRPGALARRGLEYEQLAQRNPSLIMLSMSIMGQTGPMRGVGGYAPVMSGLAGLDSLVGYSEDDLIGLYNPALGDPNGAAHALAVLMAALAGRQRTGRGRWIDVAQVECLASILPEPIVEAQRYGANGVRGNGHARWWPHGAWRCAGDDDWVAVAARTPAERDRLAGLLGLADGSDRSALEAALAAWTSARDAPSAAAALVAIGVPAGAICSFETMVASPWAAVRQRAQTVEHPYLGRQPIFGMPWRCNGQGFPVRTSAPLLGADTDAVLTEVLGLSAVRIAELRDVKAIE